MQVVVKKCLLKLEGINIGMTRTQVDQLFLLNKSHVIVQILESGQPPVALRTGTATHLVIRSSLGQLRPRCFGCLPTPHFTLLFSDSIEILSVSQQPFLILSLVLDPASQLAATQPWVGPPFLEAVNVIACLFRPFAQSDGVSS